jgi:exo-1,4-beta-D-glucosaminidase
MSKRMLRRALSSMLGLAMVISLFPSPVFASETKPPEDPLSSQVLISDWKIAPSAENSLGIAPVDTLESDTSNWVSAAVPGTVRESLEAAGLTEAQPQDFESGWWYAADLAVPGEEAGATFALEFRGITGDTTLYVNGTQISASQVITTDGGYYLVMLDGLVTAGETADIRLLVSHPEDAAATDGSIGLTGEVYLDATAAPEEEPLALAALAEVPGFSEKLTEWKIAPVGATSTGLPAVGDANTALKSGTSRWLDAVAPGTVLGNLLDAGIYDDLFEASPNGDMDVFYADNMAQIPWADFSQPWWYATTVTIPADQVGKRVNLKFQGIAYMADIYVNGNKLSNKNISVSFDDLKDDTGIRAAANSTPSGTLTADITVSSTLGTSTLTALGYNADDSRTTVGKLDPAKNYSDYSKEFIGTFRHYDIDITDYVTAGQPVDIRLKITKPLYGSDNDLTGYWVDWHPAPPDSNMGLTGNVTISTSGAVRLSNPAVASKVETDYSAADLTFYVDANNMTNAAVTGVLSGTIRNPDGTTLGSIVPKEVTVAAGAYCQEIAVEYTVEDPELWWPYLSGSQPLYHIDYTFTPDGGTASDTLTHRFGIREITLEINKAPKAASNDQDMLQFYINHQPIMLKGGGYCPTDMFLRHSQRDNQAVVEYIQYMGMNMVRDEGKFFDDDLLDLFDEYGILNMPGWCCCDRHQKTDRWSLAERFVGYEGQYSQMRNLRQHASMAAWFNGSDNPPNARMVEYAYFRIEAQLHWFDMGAVVASGSSQGSASPLTGRGGGMHMDATYDTQTPTFYYTDPQGTFGFVSEGGGGAAIPTIETIKKIIPEANLWPYNTADNYNVWNYHVCRGSFANLNVLSSFLDNTYGPSNTLEEFVARSNVYLYDVQRAQYEAQAYFRYVNTAGIVNWMLNSARPTFYWNQFDYYLNPNSSTFGTAKANEPVHIMYNPYDKNVSVINSTFDEYEDMTASIQLYDLYGNVIGDKLTKTMTVAPDGITEKTGAAVDQWVGLTLVERNADDASSTYERLNYPRTQQVTASTGVTAIWDYNTIMDTLFMPTGDVFFIRLELADKDGNVVSYNSYAEPLRNDVAGAGHSWSRSKIYQNSDLTKLNSLPAVELTASQLDSVTANGKVTQTMKVMNPTDNIAYAVELKAYTDAVETELVAPVIYSDNFFTLYPGESRVITVTHNTSDLKGDAVITWNCYNNAISGVPARAAFNLYPKNESANLAKGKAVTVIKSDGTASSTTGTDIAAVAANAATAAGNGKTFIESNLNTVVTFGANDVSFVVDLAGSNSNVTFDRIILRWTQTNAAINTRPNTVKIETAGSGSGSSAGSSAINGNYTTRVEAYDNTRSGGVMTDIILDAPVTARWLRVTPSGFMDTAPTYGAADTAGGAVGQGTLQAGSLAAPTAFRAAGIEVYAISASAFIKVVGDGTVATGGKNYTSATAMKDRVLTPATSGTDIFVLTPNVPETPVAIDVDGVDISDLVSQSGRLVTTAVNHGSIVTVRFGTYNVALLDGKNGNELDTITVPNGAKMAKPNIELSGRYATAWKNAADDTLWDFNVDTVNSDTTLYAAAWADLGTNLSERLTDWKIAPTVAGTTSGLPALNNDAAVVRSDFHTSKWIDAVVPGTVLGNLIDQGVYDDLFVAGNDGTKDVHFADNMAKIPFQDFEKPWWYATSFELPADQAGKRVNLNLQGISYMADIYVNGVKLSNKNISVAYGDLLDDTGIVASGTNNTPSGLLTSNITVANGFGTSTLSNLGYNKDDSRTAVANRLDPLNNYNDYNDKFIGTFRHYDVDITDFVTPGESVDIKIKVTRPLYGSDNDLTYYWVDWNPCPPDSNMGLTGSVTVSTSSAVRLSNPAVAAKVANDYSKADLTFYVDANNMTDAPVEGILSGTIRKPNGTTLGSIIPKVVTVAANAYCQEIAVEYSVTNPELWWPYLSGDQPLYHIDYTFTPTGGVASDNLTHRFGIRQIDVEINYASKAVSGNNTNNADMMQVYVNHKPVMLKGGGYSPTDLFLRHSQETNQAVVDYVKYMGMNMIRDEGKFFDNDLLDLFDENGIVFMPGWCCCDRHQKTNQWSLAERFVGYEGQYSQMRNLRQHAGMFVWFNGSDNPPDAKMVEYAYFRIEANLRWFDIGAVVASGSGNGSSSPLTGKGGGQHMDAAYDTQTPTFYYSDPLGTFGFVSEGGGGASIPALESLRKIIPDANLWPYNSAENYNVWNYHACRGGSFSNLTHTMSFYDNTYGPSSSIEESIARANAFLYDSQRAQFEAQAYFRYTDTAGIVNWMLNGARPTLYWNQFDYYMNPNASTFGTAKANEPVHIMYNPYGGDIALINSTFGTYNGMTATAVLYDISGKVISEKLTKTLDVAADGITDRDTSKVVPQWIGLELNAEGGYDKVTYDRLGQVTGSTGVNYLWTNDDIETALTGALTDVTFLRLELKDSTGKVVSYNSYAVPMRGDVALANHNWNRSMIHQNADLTQLNQLPNVNLTVSKGSVTKADGKVSQDITITNPTNSIAYNVELKAYMSAAKKDLVAPVIYSDNLFILFPGETRVIKVTHNQSVLDAAAEITVSCYNNVINKAGEAPTITNIYAGKGDAPYNLAKGKTVTVIDGTAPTGNDAIGNILTVPNAAENRAANGKTFIESDLATRAVLSDANIGFAVDLGSTQAFDRIIVRWNNWRSGNAPVINTRPNAVKVEVSKDGEAWTTVVNNYDNTKSGGVMSDFTLASTATARYIRVTPTGHMGAAAAYGQVDLTGVSGGVGQGAPHVAALAAATTFTVAGFEVYAYSDTPPAEPDQVTVTFESNGGSAVEAISVEPGSTITKPTNPTRSGYTFVAWYADEALTTAWVFATDTVDANITLYAKWDVQDGSGGGSGPVSGDKTTTVTLPDGTVVKTVTKTDGTVITTAQRKDGVVVVTTATPAGKTSTGVTLPKDMTSAVVTVPAEKMGPGTVAYLVNPDGSKTLVTKSYAGENGVMVPVTGSVQLEIVDNGKSFNDVSGSAWYAPAVAFASGHELFQGTSAALFAPEAPMTRSMLATVLHRLEGKPQAEDASKFSDVLAGSWYADAVDWAVESGITSGTGTGFSPDANITRESLAVMLYRYAKSIGMEVAQGEGLASFSDASSVSDWAVEAMSWAVDAGVLQGSGGRLNPGGNASRAEVATMLMRFVMALNP